MSHYSGSVPALDQADDWRDHAACRHEDPEVFFSEGKSARGTVLHAQAICHTCPVRRQCGEYAIKTGEDWGVWGGMSRNQLRQARRLRANSDARAAG
ncbi:WhiB family transcriptional regulator [Streptomyces nigra]|uniref:WhiB family transcriptional regulator n=1 Tax=Streptomyces nigra TaxID=1827580 RepID=UPI003452397C